MAEEKILERVRLLLARAEHPNTPAPEAELCLDRANKLIAKHAIEEAMLEMSMSQDEKRRPDKIEVHVGHDSAGEFWPQMRSILEAAAVANRCRVVIPAYLSKPIEVYGFHEDLRWTEMLFTVILTDFVQQVNPRWSYDKGYDENVYNFKVAGYKWADIDRIAVEHGAPTAAIMQEETQWWKAGQPTVMRPTGKYRGTLISAYKRHAKLVGDHLLVKTTSFESYREQFTQAYTNRMLARFDRMIRSNKETENETTGAALALVDRSKIIDEEIWKDHPHLHPDEIAARMEKRRLERERELQERREMLDAMDEKERAAFLEKEERKRRRNQGRVRYVAYQSAAANRGSVAAERVDLSRKRHTGGAAPQKKLD